LKLLDKIRFELGKPPTDLTSGGAA